MDSITALIAFSNLSATLPTLYYVYRINRRIDNVTALHARYHPEDRDLVM